MFLCHATVATQYTESVSQCKLVIGSLMDEMLKSHHLIAYLNWYSERNISIERYTLTVDIIMDH